MLKRALLIAILFCFLSPWAVGAADMPKLEKLIIGYPAPVASLGIVEVMRKAGLREVRLRFDFQGTELVTHS